MSTHLPIPELEKPTELAFRQASDIERQWRAVSEAARLAILISPETSQAAAELSTLPVDETLPGTAVELLSETDERIARIASIPGIGYMAFGELLGHDAVPQDLIVPDITNAPGVSPAERSLATRRFRYARDAKVLGLMAELQQEAPLFQPAEDGTVTYETPRGTKIVMTEDALEIAPSLPDPATWQSRTQLKDRVYKIIVDDKEYIMKERKTPYHTDQKELGHQPGLSSEQEFQVARHFAAKGTIRQGDIQARWERPLGYVEFPDGYQFTIFESEPAVNDHVPIHELTRKIEENPEEYREEYDQVRLAAKALYSERDDVVGRVDHITFPKPKRWPITLSARAYKQDYNNLPPADELSYEEFAAIKAQAIIDQAKELLEQTTVQDGFYNSDIDGFSIHMLDSRRAAVEIIGFDFEYYRHDPEMAAHILRSRQQYKEKGETRFALRAESDRDIVRAAKLVMAVSNGHKLPLVAAR